MAKAMRRAQDLVVAKYKLVSTVPLSERAFIVDMIYGGNGKVGISVGSTPDPEPPVNYGCKYFPEKTDSKVVAEILSYDGCYLGFQFKNITYKRYGVVHGSKTSVYISNLSNRMEYSRPFSRPQPLNMYGGEDMCYAMEKEYGPPEFIQVWPINPEISDGKNEYNPQGMVVCSSGVILICLWNNKAGERSLGKVVSENEQFEIFMDKNQPLFVCPTYIAENGNGDICVSDVGAVVVTDTGGMLRFRYQGAFPNFEPYGLCCNSACNIIIADMKNDMIHVIDKNGRFLYYVKYEGIKMPRALCIDEDDNVYVGEWNTDTIKVLSCKKNTLLM